MMKFLSLAIVMATLIGSPHKISNVETSGSWIYMYDENGHRYKSLSASNVGEVKGWGAEFFVSRNGSWIYLYFPFLIKT